MRTTITLDPDAEALLRKRMAERGLSMKRALNDALREALGGDPVSSRSFRTPTARLGMASVNLDRALQLADELQDEELVRKSRVGK
ncbi:MAG: antitoxin [Actinomycetota bacterium]|jgi:hypothetical protein|nr:antitoxin [Actinomycetota bacterium]